MSVLVILLLPFYTHQCKQQIPGTDMHRAHRTVCQGHQGCSHQPEHHEPFEAQNAAVVQPPSWATCEAIDYCSNSRRISYGTTRTPVSACILQLEANYLTDVFRQSGRNGSRSSCGNPDAYMQTPLLAVGGWFLALGAACSHNSQPEHLQAQRLHSLAILIWWTNFAQCHNSC